MVKVPVYSLISMLATMLSRLFTPWHGAVTRAHTAHVDPTLGLCTRYPSLLSGQRHCRMRSLPKAPSHDQCRESNPRPLDLRLSALLTGKRDPTNSKVVIHNRQPDVHVICRLSGKGMFHDTRCLISKLCCY